MQLFSYEEQKIYDIDHDTFAHLKESKYSLIDPNHLDIIEDLVKYGLKIDDYKSSNISFMVNLKNPITMDGYEPQNFTAVKTIDERGVDLLGVNVNNPNLSTKQQIIMYNRALFELRLFIKMKMEGM